MQFALLPRGKLTPFTPGRRPCPQSIRLAGHTSGLSVRQKWALSTPLWQWSRGGQPQKTRLLEQDWEQTQLHWCTQVPLFRRPPGPRFLWPLETCHMISVLLFFLATSQEVLYLEEMFSAFNCFVTTRGLRKSEIVQADDSLRGRMLFKMLFAS